MTISECNRDITSTTVVSTSTAIKCAGVRGRSQTLYCPNKIKATLEGREQAAENENQHEPLAVWPC